MGGNSISGSSRRVSTPTVSPREAKLNKVLEEMKELSPAERKSAIATLKKAGLTDLAKALDALLPASTGGSRPPERVPSSSTGKSGGGGKR